MYDILIVGSGIIGTFIAEKLMTQDLRIGLIEAGNMEGCLYDMKYVETGQKEKIKIVNAYQFGGGHNVWHGLLARQSNSEIEESEKFWGLTKEEFSNYYDSAEEYLGLKPSERDKIKTTIERKLRLNNLNNLDTKIFYQPDLCFSKKTMYKRLTENNIKIYLDEKVEKINQYLEKYYVIETNNGIKLFTKVIVLAANPIQNIAIISNSFDELNKNIKYSIADHPMGVVGKIKFRKKIRLPIIFIREKIGKSYAKVGIMVSDEINNLRHTFYVIPTMEENFNGSNTNLRQQLIAMRDSGLSVALIIKIMANISTIIFIIAYKLGWIFKTRYADIVIVSEQEISEENYIKINGGKIYKNWNISDQLIDSITKCSLKLIEKLNITFQVESIKLLDKNELKNGLTSAAHLCCTLPLGDATNEERINNDYSIKDKPGLFIAGSSIFPRALSLNNTLTAVAISHKLISNIRKYLRSNS